MMSTLEERLASAMRTAAPDLRPDPRLGRLAVERARRNRRWRWVVAPIGTAFATAAVFLLIVVIAHGDDEVFAVDSTTGRLVEAPDWAGCLRQDASPVSTPLVREPVAVAVCGTRLQRHAVVDEGLPNRVVDVPVWVDGRAAAEGIVRELESASPGAWIDTCAYTTCEEIAFALLDRGGAVSQFVLTLAGADGQIVTGEGQSWIVDLDVAQAIRRIAVGEPSWVYVSGVTIYD